MYSVIFGLTFSLHKGPREACVNELHTKWWDCEFRYGKRGRYMQYMCSGLPQAVGRRQNGRSGKVTWFRTAHVMYRGGDKCGASTKSRWFLGDKNFENLLFSKYIEVALQAVSPTLLNPVPWENSDKVTETVFHRFLRFALEPEIQQFQNFWSRIPVFEHGCLGSSNFACACSILTRF